MVHRGVVFLVTRLPGVYFRGGSGAFAGGDLRWAVAQVFRGEGH